MLRHSMSALLLVATFLSVLSVGEDRKTLSRSQLPGLYVLSIGVSENGNPAIRRKFAADDANSVAKAFQTHSAGVYGKIETKSLVGKAATREGILQGFDWLAKRVTQHDVAVVFYEGFLIDDNKSTCLMTVDADTRRLSASAVRAEQMFEAFSRIPGRLVLMLDADHSGNNPAKGLHQELSGDELGVLVFSACLGKTHPLASEEHKMSFFTKAVCEALAGEHDTDANGDGIVNTSEFEAAVSILVKDWTGGEQHPVTSKPASIRHFPLARVSKK